MKPFQRNDQESEDIKVLKNRISSLITENEKLSDESEELDKVAKALKCQLSAAKGEFNPEEEKVLHLK